MKNVVIGHLSLRCMIYTVFCRGLYMKIIENCPESH